MTLLAPAEVETALKELEAYLDAHCNGNPDCMVPHKSLNRLNSHLAVLQDRLDALVKIDAIRNSIIGSQTMTWTAHVYPLVKALEDAGIHGMGYEAAREHTLYHIVDTERMEWLEERGREACAGIESRSPQGLRRDWYWRVHFQGVQPVEGATLRASIDEAMKIPRPAKT